MKKPKTLKSYTLYAYLGTALVLLEIKFANWETNARLLVVLVSNGNV